MLIIALIVRKNEDFFPNLFGYFGFDSSTNSLSNTRSRNEATQAELVMAQKWVFKKNNFTRKLFKLTSTPYVKFKVNDTPFNRYT